MAAEASFLPPDNIREILNKENGVNDNLESFLAQWKGTTPNNEARAALLRTKLREFGNTVAFLNPKGNGCCLYECLFMFLKLVQPGVPYETYNELREELLQHMHDKMRGLGMSEKDIHGMGFSDANCPDIEIAIATFCELHNLSAAVIQHPRKPSVLKFRTEGSDDFLTLFVNEGHVYLLFPHVGTRSREVRQALFETIEEEEVRRGGRKRSKRRRSNRRKKRMTTRR